MSGPISLGDWAAMIAFLCNFGAILKAYAHFEHRFTRLETQMDMLLKIQQPHREG